MMSWLLSMLNVYLPPVQLPLPLQDATHSGLQIDNEGIGIENAPRRKSSSPPGGATVGRGVLTAWAAQPVDALSADQVLASGVQARRGSAEARSSGPSRMSSCGRRPTLSPTSLTCLSTTSCSMWSSTGVKAMGRDGPR